jgi:hypothetical protein
VSTASGGPHSARYVWMADVGGRGHGADTRATRSNALSDASQLRASQQELHRLLRGPRLSGAEALEASKLKPVDVMVDHADGDASDGTSIMDGVRPVSSRRVQVRVASLAPPSELLASPAQRALSVTQRALGVTQRALSVTQRALGVTQRALSVTQRALSVTQRALGVTQRALSVTQRALRVTQRALSVTQRALSVTVPASSQRPPASS